MKRKSKNILNRWRVFGFVFLAAILTTIYVYNVIGIDGLLEDTQELKKEFDSIKNSNEILATELIELQSPERITKIASEKLGMLKAERSPEIIP